ncbi:MAG: acyl-CoA dehydrogenase family protein [Fimbriimonadaceae bacterium]
MSNALEILKLAEEFLLNEVRPRAQEIDRDPETLRWALDGLAQRGFLGLRISPEFGGMGIAEPEFRAFQEFVARASGSLAFLQTQHQSAASLISKSDNEVLRTAYLANMAGGTARLGIGFSQLRRAGPPMMQASPIPAGYLLYGAVPWITGLGFFEEFVIGATLPSGEAVFGIVPFREQPGIELSDVMQLCAMESAQTVSGEIKNLVLPHERVLFIKPANWIANNDMINITLQGHFALGCAQAGVDVLRQAYERKPLDFILTTADQLQDEIDNCRQSAITSQGLAESTQERLDIRAWAIDLAVRCAHAAITASSGAANSLSHPAQRIYREALVYTVSAQTSEIMRATLERLASKITP